MKYIINSGVYEVDLKGTNDAEFNGSHPSIILQSIKNEDMYYIIPLTTYTKERWENYRKYLCCRIISTNSIARIDKMQVRHKSKIPKRWLEGDTLIIPTPDEMDNIYDKIKQYLDLSIQSGKKDYLKYYNNYHDFSHKVNDFFNNYNFSLNTIFNISYTDKELICACNLSNISRLSFEDTKRIIWSVFERKDVIINYDKLLLNIKISLNNKIALTFKENYATFELAEGQQK